MFTLSVISDEVSQDFDRIVAVAQDFPRLKGVEPRSIWDKPLTALTDADVAEIKRRADAAGLKIVALASPFFKCDLGNAEHYAQHLEYLRRFAAIAHAWDCKIVRGFTFWKTGPAAAVWPQLLEAFAEPLRICEQEDLYLGIENEASTHIATAAEAARLYTDVNHPRLRAIWDPANEVYAADGERPFPEAWDRVKPWVIHVHLKDAVKDPALPDGARCVPIGEGGLIDFPGQFRALEEMGYTGACSLETHWRPQKELDTDLLNRPGGAAFSEGGEEASRICLGNIERILGEIG
ncbi:MAG TPA: sugar phosphate isomerase/epimerase family protein [Armatimonadota bacterium]|jgi:sugar phosphate isomerase/epimerase